MSRVPGSKWTRLLRYPPADPTNIETAGVGHSKDRLTLARKSTDGGNSNREAVGSTTLGEMVATNRTPL